MIMTILHTEKQATCTVSETQLDMHKTDTQRGQKIKPTLGNLTSSYQTSDHAVKPFDLSCAKKTDLQTETDRRNLLLSPRSVHFVGVGKNSTERLSLDRITE